MKNEINYSIEYTNNIIIAHTHTYKHTHIYTHILLTSKQTTHTPHHPHTTHIYRCLSQVQQEHRRA